MLDDVDRVGGVAILDFLILVANFRQDLGQYSQGDINEDGTIDLGDFLILAKNFGEAAQAAAALEPNSASLITIASIVVGLVTRRLR